MLYYYNPQKLNLIGKTVHDAVRHGLLPAKYEYMKTMITDGNVGVLFDETGSSFNKVNSKFLPRQIRILIIALEICIWCIVNGVNIWKTPIRYAGTKLSNDDVIFLFSHTTIDKELSDSHALVALLQGECKKVVHLTHFYFNTSLISKNLSSARNVRLIHEVKLRRRSEYFSAHFDIAEPVISLPFCLKDRYFKSVSIAERSHKCLLIGSTLYIGEQEKPALADFCAFFGNGYLHPDRVAIKIIADHFPNLFQSMAHIRSAGQDRRVIDLIEGLGGDLAGKLSKKLSSQGNANETGYYAKSNYYKFDIVKLFNDHSMFVCPCEIGDLPPINAIEGMACGSVLIASEIQIYEDFGMTEGEHFIGYDGTIKDLLAKVEYFQSHPDSIEKIAANGEEFAKSMFDERNILNQFQLLLLNS